MFIQAIHEHKDIAKYIISRWLLSQYKKAKTYLLDGNLKAVDFKIRQPRNKGYYQFRINQQYRGFWYFEWDILYIFEISDHQDF